MKGLGEEFLPLVSFHNIHALQRNLALTQTHSAHIVQRVARLREVVDQIALNRNLHHILRVLLRRSAAGEFLAERLRGGLYIDIYLSQLLHSPHRTAPDHTP